MLLTTCTVCSAPLSDGVVQCVDCATRYCGERCERMDRRRNGHGKVCGNIARGGGAEQYHADKKYEEAATEAVEACAEETAGKTCYICLEGDNLVRGCSCRGEAGYVHLSCLVRQAEVAPDGVRWERWGTCRLCEQGFHGAVRLAMGRACWKTYCSRSEDDDDRWDAFTQVGCALFANGHAEDALVALEAGLAAIPSVFPGGGEIESIAARSNIAACLSQVGREAEALESRREVYNDSVRVHGHDDEDTFIAATNFALALSEDGQHAEAQSMFRERLSAAQRTLGPDHWLFFKLCLGYEISLTADDDAPLQVLMDALVALDDALPRARRVLGPDRPLANALEESRGDLRKHIDRIARRGL